MISKKTQDVLNVIKNIYEIVEGAKAAGYAESIDNLITEAIKKTAEEDEKGYSTVAASLTRGLDINGKGAMEKVRDMIKDACMNKEENHNLDDLVVILEATANENDDSPEEVRKTYLDIFKK